MCHLLPTNTQYCALLPRASGYHLGCIYVTEAVLSTLGEIKSSEMQAQFSGGGSSVSEHNYPGDRSYYVQRTEREIRNIGPSSDYRRLHIKDI